MAFMVPLVKAVAVAFAAKKAGDALGGNKITPMIQQQETPATPTVDEAAKNLSQYTRLQRRRGVLANLYGGAQGAGPAVGQKTLLGQ